MAISKIITSSLTDDAVTSAKIGTDQVGADALSSSAISGAVDIPANSVGQSELSIDLSAQSVPHIIPGVLYPAVGGNDINGTDIDTSHGSTYTYGELHTDGRKYYYTDIKGSKPIKDPRIGGYFGSQRHKFKSLQFLEQETATHGSNVYSVDGRKWIRCVNGTNGWNARSDSQGTCIEVNRGNLDGTDFMEITGYFNFANISVFHNVDHQDQTSIFLNGTDTTNDLNVGDAIATPLMTRFVDPGALVNLNLGTINTPGINTIKLTVSDASSNNHYALFYAIELIAQDTTSTANRSKIQIPSQNVVSFGKKFNISGTPHYDPFNGFTSGSSVSSYVDTATSLGLDKWLHSSTYYRPYNGMRVIKWVDENGTIKTSVTCMPPNAKSIGDSSSLTNATAKANASASNDTFYPTFEAHTTDVNEDQLHEVAKTFHFREFGNGSANGGTGATYADTSMLATSGDNITYVMDDGTTSLSGSGYAEADGTVMYPSADSEFNYITFIGTGVSYKATKYMTGGSQEIAQNLPFGTHVLKTTRGGSAVSNSTYMIDGINFGAIDNGAYGSFTEVSFYQPKKPPIPEDACVIADYMLMADFVPVGANGGQYISKGVRGQALSRDIFADANASYDAFTGSHVSGGHAYGYRLVAGAAANSPTSTRVRLPSFGTNFVTRAYQFGSRHDLYINTTIQSSNQTIENSPNSTAVYDTYAHLTNAQDLGVYEFGFNAKNGQALNASALEIATPIHTSSHYQPFETPFLHELVGGDRNMEQTNLVVSPDGKTWGEVTRDTSYIGSNLVSARVDQGSTSGFLYASAVVQWDMWRGNNWQVNCGNKDWAIAYDRMICLKDGEYTITAVILHGGNHRTRVRINGSAMVLLHETGANDTGTMHITQPFKRGDYIDFYDGTHEQTFSHFQISKV